MYYWSSIEHILLRERFSVDSLGAIIIIVPGCAHEQRAQCHVRVGVANKTNDLEASFSTMLTDTSRSNA